jgi:uncharacterized membrane protein
LVEIRKNQRNPDLFNEGAPELLVKSLRGGGFAKHAQELTCHPKVGSTAIKHLCEATMETRNPVSSANLMGHPMHPILITLPIGFFVATFLFDLIFWRTGTEAFATGALWLLGAGLVAAAAAAVTGLIDFLGDRRIRALGDAWQHAIGNVILVLVQLFSFYQRYRYGTSAVVPLGLVLSLIAVCILLFTGWKGGEMVFRHRVAVYDEPRP